MLPGYKFFAAAVCKVCAVVRQCAGVTLRAKRAAAVLGSPVCNQQGSSATIITSPATILYGTWGSSSSSMVCFLLAVMIDGQRNESRHGKKAVMRRCCGFCSCPIRLRRMYFLQLLTLLQDSTHRVYTTDTTTALPWAAHSVSFKANHGKTVASYGSRPWRRPQEQE